MTSESERIEVESSNGCLLVHPLTGEVLACTEYRGCGGMLKDIMRFDTSTLDAAGTDILNTRFWLSDGTCVEPTVLLKKEELRNETV